MRVDKTMDNAQDCLCLKCPSYTTVCKIKNNLLVIDSALFASFDYYIEQFII